MARTRKTPPSAADLRKQIAALQRQLRAAEKREAKPPARAARAPSARTPAAPSAPSAPRPRMRIRGTASTSAPRAPADFAARVRGLRQSGVSGREIARRSGVSESMLRDVQSGRRRLSSTKAENAVKRLEAYQTMERPRTVVLKGGEVVSVEPVGLSSRPNRMTDREKIGQYRRMVREAIASGDYTALRKLKPSERTVRIRGADGKSRKVTLETDPRVLQELVESGELLLDDLEGPT